MPSVPRVFCSAVLRLGELTDAVGKRNSRTKTKQSARVRCDLIHCKNEGERGSEFLKRPAEEETTLNGQGDI